MCVSLKDVETDKWSKMCFEIIIRIKVYGIYRVGQQMLIFRLAGKFYKMKKK